MKNTIQYLKERMNETIDLHRGISPREDIQDEIAAYTRAINELEKYYYGEPHTKLSVVLSDYEGDFYMESKAPKFVINDADAVFDVANVLGGALDAKPPYVFEIESASNTRKEVTYSREELLEFYMNWAMDELYQLIEDDE